MKMCLLLSLFLTFGLSGTEAHAFSFNFKWPASLSTQKIQPRVVQPKAKLWGFNSFGRVYYGYSSKAVCERARNAIRHNLKSPFCFPVTRRTI